VAKTALPQAPRGLSAEERACRRWATTKSADDEKKFTSWKLDFQKYVVADPRLKPADKLVAICILHHINCRTGITFPSAETISDEVCIGHRHVTRALRRLKETGWLIAQRRFNNSNLYRVSDKNMNAMLDRLLLLKEARQEARASARQRGRKQNPLRWTPESRRNPPLRWTPESCTERTPESSLHLKDVHTGTDSQEKKNSHSEVDF